MVLSKSKKDKKRVKGKRKYTRHIKNGDRSDAVYSPVLFPEVEGANSAPEIREEMEIDGDQSSDEELPYNRSHAYNMTEEQKQAYKAKYGELDCSKVDEIFMPNNLKGVEFNYSVFNQGGNFDIYKAENATRQMTFAVRIRTKRSRNLEIAKLEEMPYIERMIKIMGDLGEHPRLTKFIGFRWEPPCWKMFVEFHEKKDFYDRIRVELNQPSMSEFAKQFLFRQLIEGVEYMHSKNYAHLDLKLENCFRTAEGLMKLGDFDAALKFELKALITRQFLGTKIYASPQVLAGQGFRPDCADIWSCGIILFELYFNDLPWTEAKPSDPLFRRWLMNPEKFLANYKIDKKIHPLLLGMLEVDEKKRLTIEQIKNDEWYLEGVRNYHILNNL